MLLSWLGLVVVALGGLGAVLAAVPSTLFDLDRFGVPKELVLHLTALALLPLILARRKRLELGLAETLLGLFVVWSALSAAFATNHWMAIRALGITASGVVVYFGGRVVAEGIGPRPVVIALTLAVLIGGATGLAQAYGYSSELLTEARAPGGTFGNRNFMAHLMVIGLPLAAWLFVTTARRASVVVWSLALAAMIGAVVMSRSRAAWLGLVAAAAVTALVGLLTRRGREPRVPRRRLGQLGLALGLGALGALVIPNQLDWKSSTPYRDSLRRVLSYQEGSGRGRLVQYRNSLKLVERDPLLGTGPGNWPVLYPLVTTPGDPSYDAVDPMPTNPWPSSDWVATVAERGPVGGLLLGLALFGFVVIAVRRSASPEGGAALAGLAAVGLVTAASVEGLFDAVLLLAPPTFVVMASLGALLPATRPVATLEGRRRRWALGAVALVVLAAGLRSGTQLASILAAGTGSPRSRLEQAVRYDPASFRLEILLALRTSCPEAAIHARRAAELLPYHPIPRQLATKCR
jgi:O-antigen ligase